MKKSIRHTCCNAFTLIELLTVIAIIGILAAIIIPTVGKVRQSARRAECASNLRQLHTAIMLHAQDEKDTLIAGQSNFHPTVNWYLGYSQSQWVSPLASYTGGKDTLQKIAVCPENRTPEPVAGTVQCDYGYPYTVNYNVLIDYSGSPKNRIRLAEIHTPSQVVMMTDSAKDSAWGRGFSVPTNSAWSRIGTPHSGRANILWCDGHVTLNTKKDIEDKTTL